MTTTYVYDAASELASMTSPTGQKWTFGYDADGNQISMVDANGNSTPAAGDGTTTRAYDAAGRLTSIAYSDSTPGASFTYDAVGNTTQMTDGGGAQTYTYDAANRLTGVTRGTDTFSYAYDLAGNLTSRTYPGAVITTYGYDNDERLASATSGGLATSYSYDAASNLTQTTLPAANGYVETRTYDRGGRVTEVKNAKGTSVLSDFAYTLDAVGNPTSVVRSGATSSTTTYGYDVNDRLTSVCFQASCPGSSDPFIRWTYDAVGNRLTEARSTGTTTYTYNAADQLTQAGSTAYTYDQNGNEKSAGSRTFSYDLANRLVSTTSGNTTTTYTYDGDSNRLQASTGQQASKKTNFLWDSSGDFPQVALERDGSGSVLRSYRYGARRISMATGGSTYYYHYDSIGSVTNVTSSTGASQWTEAYEPFGSIRTETKNATSAPGNFLKYVGEYQDATGLYYLRARQYDPTSGRFAQIDPAVPERTSPYLSTYLYVGDRPTVMVDPSGKGSLFADNSSQTRNLEATSPDSLTYGINCALPLSDGPLRNARVVFTLAKLAGLSSARAREMVAAACQESKLIATTPSPGKGLFQLISREFVDRANAQGGVFSAHGNTCGILPDFVYYWSRHPRAAAGVCAACVEASSLGPSFYAAPLSRLPKSFKPIAVKPCRRLKHAVTRPCY